MITVTRESILSISYWFVYSFAVIDMVKWNGKKYIQKRVGLITYSLKVINGTNVVFEVSLVR